jgi:hypothetical protein
LHQADLPEPLGVDTDRLAPVASTVAPPKTCPKSHMAQDTQHMLDLINVINGAHSKDCKSEEEFWTRRTEAIQELETISGCTFKRQSDITALHNKLKHEAA